MHIVIPKYDMKFVKQMNIRSCIPLHYHLLPNLEDAFQTIDIEIKNICCLSMVRNQIQCFFLTLTST